jgi:hypothetical protein
MGHWSDSILFIAVIDGRWWDFITSCCCILLFSFSLSRTSEKNETALSDKQLICPLPREKKKKKTKF